MGHLDSRATGPLTHRTTDSHEPAVALPPLRSSVRHNSASSRQRQEVAPPTLALVAALSAAGGWVTHAWARATHSVHVALPLAALAGVAALALAPSACCRALIQCRQPNVARAGICCVDSGAC